MIFPRLTLEIIAISVLGALLDVSYPAGVIALFAYGFAIAGWAERP